MKKIIVLIVVQLIRVNISFAETAYVPFATTLAKSGTEFSLTAEYFNTTSVIDTNGDVSSFDSDTTFQKTDVDLNLKYGFTDRFEGQLMLKGRSITSKFNADFGDGLQDYTSSQTGAESAGIGFKFSSKEMEGVKYALEGWYKNAFYSVDRFESGEPGKLSLGEGSREYAIGGNIYFRTKSRTVLDARVYYRSPGETLSKEIFSQFQLALVWDYVALYLGVESVNSLKDDAYSDDPENKPGTFQAASGQFNSVNRQWVAPYLGFGLGMGKNWRLKFQYAQVTQGESTDLGQRFLLGLTYRNEPVGNAFVKRDESFKQYRVEGVVKKVSKSKRVVVIDKGITGGLHKGMSVDFFYFNYTGGNELFATGIIVKTEASSSYVQVTKKYSRRRVEEGTVFRADEVLE